ncbi:MAG: response regulator transcription factor [Epsilonproteobacteria bacterium]|nr:response regulator transcription factor [Campylobacterota bacterium]
MKHHSCFAKLKNLHLLYVEDDTQVRHQISEFLERYFASMQEASSAEEAMKYFKEKKPDIVLLDINLPGKNGLTFASEIRKNHGDTRIIISTAYTDKDFLLLAVELELTRYLVKPLTGTKLLEALEKAADEYALIFRNDYIVDLGEGFSYNQEEKVVMYNKEEVILRRKEMQILEFFIGHPNKTVDYATLEYAIWTDSSTSRDAIRAQIRNLRKKTHPKIIENINAIGYRLYRKE